MDIEKLIDEVFKLGQEHQQNQRRNTYSSTISMSDQIFQRVGCIKREIIGLLSPVPAMPMQGVPLSDEEIQKIWIESCKEPLVMHAFARSVERKVIAKATPIPKQEISISRQSIIDVLLSTAGLSEGITADAIIEAIGAKKEPAGAVPDDIEVSIMALIGAAKENEFVSVDIALIEQWLSQVATSPRITEQDAMDKEVIANVISMWDDIYPDMESGKYTRERLEDAEFNEIAKLRALLNKPINNDCIELNQFTPVEYPSGHGVLIVAHEDVNGVVIVRDESGEYRRVAKCAIKVKKS